MAIKINQAVQKISSSLWLQTVAVILIFILSTLLDELLNVKICFIFYLLFAAYCVVIQSGKRKRFLSLIFFASIIIICTQFSNDIKSDLKYLEIETEPKFIACKDKAIPVAKEGFIGVCERKDHDWARFIDTIIFDSTDEILLVSARRSKEWKTAATSLDKQAPFGVLGFYAKKMTGHYYKVTFEYDQSPDF